MNILLLCCSTAVVAAASLVVGAQVERPAAWGQPTAGLRMAIWPANRAVNRSGPEFDVTIENAGDEDVVVNMGFMLANGKVMFPDAIRLRLTDAKGAIRELEYFDRGYPGVAGRVDDFVVSLRSRSAYSIRATMDRYWSPRTKEWGLTLAPGKYQIEADFNGQGARFANADTPGVALLNYWKGTLRSNTLSFEVP